MDIFVPEYEKKFSIQCYVTADGQEKIIHAFDSLTVRRTALTAEA